MNDYKITLNKRQEHFLSRLLPKGYSFELYKVRKNINDYAYKEYDKKYKKTDSIILSKRQSFMIDSLQPSEKSFRQKSQVPSIPKQNLSPLQIDLLWLVQKFRKHESSYPFRAPVDPKALQVPDYFDVVLEPIDLKKIQEQIRAQQYQHISEFERDIYKMLMNSYKFNQKSTTTYNKTVLFEQFFCETIKNWQKIKEEELGQLKDERYQVKDEMVEQNATMMMRNEEMERKMESFNLWSFKENNSAAPPLTTPAFELNSLSDKKETKPPKIVTEIGQQRPRVSKKKLPKIQQTIKKLYCIQSRQLEPLQEVTKRQQPQAPTFKAQQFVLIPQQPLATILSQPQQSQYHQTKKQQQQQVNDELGDDLENETVKEQNFSQGYNEFNTGNKIRNIQVQKEITSLLKKLNQYPLTKQKKNKLLSKFTNLDQNMTQTDKKRLFQRISKLDENDVEFVIKILTRNKQQIIKQEEFQLDLDKADSKVLRQIQNFIAIRDTALFFPIDNPTLISFTPSLDLVKLPKKIKKQEKKLFKKKLSRKNSNNDQSFSINPPQIKKKKSEKPYKKHIKGDEQSSINVQVNSANQQKSSSSSYRPQVPHLGRPNTAMHIQKPSQTQKIIKPGTLQIQKQTYAEKRRQQTKNESSRYEHNQIFISPSPQPCHNTAYHYEAREYDDIDQFLVSSSKHFPNDPESSPEHGPFTSGRKKRHSLDHLDFMDDHHFQFGKSGLKDYGDEEIQEYSMEEQGDVQNDEDQFL